MRIEKNTNKTKAKENRKARSEWQSTHNRWILRFTCFSFRKNAGEKKPGGCPIHISKHTDTRIYDCAPRLYVVEKFAQPKYVRVHVPMLVCVCVCEWLIIFAALLVRKTTIRLSLTLDFDLNVCVFARGAG